MLVVAIMLLFHAAAKQLGLTSINMWWWRLRWWCFGSELIKKENLSSKRDMAVMGSELRWQDSYTVLL